MEEKEEKKRKHFNLRKQSKKEKNNILQTGSDARKIKRKRKKKIYNRSQNA